jgi:hypothetical protein
MDGAAHGLRCVRRLGGSHCASYLQSFESFPAELRKLGRCMSYDTLTDTAGLPRPVELPLLAPARDDPHLPRRHPAHVVNHLAISFCLTAFGRASWRGSFLVGSIPPTSTALLWCVRVQNRRPFRSVLFVRRLLNGVFAPAASTLLRNAVAVGSPSTVVCAEHERCRKRPPPLVLGFLRCRQDSDERRRGYVSVAPQPILPPMSQTATSHKSQTATGVSKRVETGAGRPSASPCAWASVQLGYEKPEQPKQRITQA